MKVCLSVKVFLILFISINKVDSSLYSILGSFKNTFFGEDGVESESSESDENLNFRAKIQNSMKNKIKNMIVNKYKKKLVDSLKNLVVSNVLEIINPNEMDSGRINWKNWLKKKVKKIFLKNENKKEEEVKNLKRKSNQKKFEVMTTKNTNNLKKKLFNNNFVNNFKRS